MASATIAKRIDDLEAGHGTRRVMIVRQDLDDEAIYYDEHGHGHTDDDLAAMAQDPDVVIIRIEYVEGWPGA